MPPRPAIEVYHRIVTAAATAPALTDLDADRGRDFLFRTVAPDTLQGRLAAERWDTAAILHVDNPYGTGLAEHFRAAYEAAGGRVVAQVGHPEPTGDSYASELRAALSGAPDVVAAYGYSRHAEVYVKEAAETFGFRMFLFADGTKSLDLVAAVGADTLEGLVGTARPAVRPGACRVRPPVPGGVRRQAPTAVHREHLRRAGGVRDPAGRLSRFRRARLPRRSGVPVRAQA